MLRPRTRAAVAGVLLLVLVLTGCRKGTPSTIVPGSEVTVGWGGSLTSLNAAASPTSGNLDIAEATRADFGDVVDGAFVPDASFGKVTILDDSPFRVRYDLAEPSWSDGIPVDAADLLLGWAASTGRLAGGGAKTTGDGPAVPAVDEFARAIEVTLPEPSSGWQTAIRASVPAHVVGERALGLDDPMQAKQAVIRAIQHRDDGALRAISAVWRTAFDVGRSGGISADLRLSSGPYQVDRVTRGAEQSITLVANQTYRGASTPQVARIELVPPGDDPVSALGKRLDVIQVAPTARDRGSIRQLERRDSPVLTSHDGSIWTVLLRPSAVFAAPSARTAFLRAVPVREVVDGGAGEWASAYTATTSMLTAPSSAAYGIVSEDSGFASTLGTPSSDAAVDREAAGVAAGSSVCVLYDRTSEFASGAYAALRDTVGAEGWNAADCGVDDIGAGMRAPGWDAAIVRVPLPQTPARIAAQWGSGSDESLVGSADADRDALIEQLARTVDVYDARELLARIEATIVEDAVARPLAVDPRVTVTVRGVTGVAVRNGPAPSLLHGAVEWAVVR